MKVSARFRWLEESTLNAMTPLMVAAAPGPVSPLNPAVPLPAIVLMFPVTASTMRTRKFPKSLM